MKWNSLENNLTIRLTPKSDRVLTGVALAAVAVAALSGQFIDSAVLVQAASVGLALVTLLHYRFYSARISGDVLTLSGPFKRKKSFPLQDLTGHYPTPSHHLRPMQIHLVAKADQSLAFPILNSNSTALLEKILVNYGNQMAVNNQSTKKISQHDHELRAVPVQREAILFCLIGGAFLMGLAVHWMRIIEPAKVPLMLMPMAMGLGLFLFGYACLNEKKVVIGLNRSGISFLGEGYYTQYPWNQIASYKVEQALQFVSYKLTLKSGKVIWIDPQFLVANAQGAEYLQRRLAESVQV